MSLVRSVQRVPPRLPSLAQGTRGRLSGLVPRLCFGAALLTGSAAVHPAAAQSTALDNAFVHVTENGAPCASMAEPYCGDRVIVALEDLEIGSGPSAKRLARGEIAVYGPDQTHDVPRGGHYFEVAIKPTHPPGDSPGEMIPPEKDQIIYDAPDFFVFHEGLAVGDTRARHSHSQRVVFQLNATRLQQWPDGQPELLRDIVPNHAGFNPPVIHIVKNLGERPLRGIVIEFKTAASRGEEWAVPNGR